MAINPNTTLSNKNTLYLACSGGGKSQALKQNREIPANGARVVMWDIDHDHRGQHFDTLEQFRRALITALKSGRGFRVAYSGEDTVEAFEAWCRMVWAILDGNKITYVIIEELADVSPSVSKATPEFGRLLRKGRKFGARLHVTSQRSAEIPKTAYTQCPVKWVGQQEAGDVRNMAKIAGVSVSDIEALQPLSYYVKQPGPDAGVLKKLRYKR